MALTDNLIAYWKLDEISGNASDSSGNGYTLTNNNTVGYASGKINNGADFGSSNTNKYFSATLIDPDSYNSGFSIGFWVKFNSLASSQKIFSFNDLSWGGIHFRALSSTDTRFRFGNGVTSDGGETAYTSSWSTGTWYYIVMTHSATANKYYVNGSQVATDTTSVTLANNGTTFNIGRDTGNNEYANSIVDEFGIWGKELSSTEVTALYNSGNGISYPFSAGPANLKSYNTNLKANIKSINGNLIANVKSLNTNS
jgi:hypothetical protein